jgi:hypothetical protein
MYWTPLGTWLVDADHSDHGNLFLEAMETQGADKHHVQQSSDESHDAHLLSTDDFIL